jgi:hypothetical protein
MLIAPARCSDVKAFEHLVLLSNYSALNFSAVICPIQQCLPLFRPATRIILFTVLSDLRGMSYHRFPPFDLTFVIRASPAHIIPAIPLKPPSGIFMINPAFFPPDGQRLGSIDAEVIQLGIMAFMTKLCVRKPLFGKLIPAIGHVLAAEHPHLQHLFGRYFRRESGMEVLSHRLRKTIRIVFLHQVVDDHLPPLHHSPLSLSISAGWKACPTVLQPSHLLNFRPPYFLI